MAMNDAERIAAAVERIKLATAGAKVNERAVRRLGRRLSRWLRRQGIDRVTCGHRFWWPDFWGFHTLICGVGIREHKARPDARKLCEIAECVVVSTEGRAHAAAEWADDAYRTRHKLEDVLRHLGVE